MIVASVPKMYYCSLDGTSDVLRSVASVEKHHGPQCPGFVAVVSNQRSSDPKIQPQVAGESSGVSYALFSRLCKDGIPIAMYRLILDRLCEQGWPEACMMQSSDGRVRIFKTAYVEDIDRAITHYRRREQTDIWHPSRHHRYRDHGSGT